MAIAVLGMALAGEKVNAQDENVGLRVAVGAICQGYCVQYPDSSGCALTATSDCTACGVDPKACD